jgi:uncharacterized membrane protein
VKGESTGSSNNKEVYEMKLIENVSDENVGEIERLMSLIGGGALLLYGLVRRSGYSIPIALLGGGLVYRGATGYCHMYGALGVSTSGQGEPYGRGIKVHRTIVIDKPAEELYRFWRDLENLPKFMDHLKSVEVTDKERSRWAAKAPAGMTVEWDAEITVDRENEMIGWRSLEGADVDNAGYVRFETAPGGRGTLVRVHLQYNPPAGKIGGTVAKLFGEEPELQIQDDLHRFKQLMETGEIATTHGQPSGRDKELGRSIEAQQKLSRAVTGSGGKKDVVQKSSEDSFPASDPPAWTQRR